MKSGTLCGCAVAALVAGLSLGAYAEVKENPYQIIIDRNPFALKPIPPPPPPVSETNSTPPPPPVEVKLTGITTLLGPPKVFLEIVNTQTKKTERPPGMLVGEKQNDVEVLAVDPEKGVVRIRNGDAETTLDFEHNGIKPGGATAAAAAPAPHPGMVPFTMPSPAPPVPGQATTAVSPNNNNSRALVAGGTPTPAVAPNAAMGNPLFGGGASIPTRPLRADFGNNVVVAGGGQPINNPAIPAPAAVPTMSREDAEARIEAQRRILEAKEQQGAAPAGISRILPPTRFSPPPTPGVAQ